MALVPVGPKFPNPEESLIHMTTFTRYKLNDNGSSEYRQEGSTVSFRCSEGMFEGKAPDSLSVELPSGAAFAAVNSAKLEAEQKKAAKAAEKEAAAAKKEADKAAKAKAAEDAKAAK